MIFLYAITNINNLVSGYTKTSIKPLNEFKDKIYNRLVKISKKKANAFALAS